MLGLGFVVYTSFGLVLSSITLGLSHHIPIVVNMFLMFFVVSAYFKTFSTNLVNVHFFGSK